MKPAAHQAAASAASVSPHRAFSGQGASTSGQREVESNTFERSGWWQRYRLPRCVRVGAAVAGKGGIVRGASVVTLDGKGAKMPHIVWDDGGPRTCLLVKKPSSRAASQALKEIALWLEARGLRVLVERPVNRTEFPEYAAFDPYEADVDFCVTLGGDGTVLHLTSLFTQDEPLPPVVSFAMGTLGFLTPFESGEAASTLERVLAADTAPVFCTLRTRRRCEVVWGGQVQRVHHVLNECLVDRGASPAMVCLECYIDGHHITTVQADGLIIATPSGSTAYSLSAGGPMVAPSVPSTLLTPIAPHSLSFRPLVVPEASDIEIHLPASARSHARASFDGRHTMRLLRESSIRCTTSACALPVITLGRLDHDWYEGIVQKLKWNVPIREPCAPSPGFRPRANAVCETDD
ncbi:hypothetical protein WJX81_000190 [Elliptochloris bilobata]|uniref:Uncharacterized protein n=1 Tax=Elliptochloris bilobata TaxID=381761 RepID=A0AAW1RG33_9CHLO